MLTHELSRHWWMIALRGVLALVFGILTFIVPAATVLLLVYLFAAYALIDGVIALGAAFRMAGGDWRGEAALVVEGILGIVAGIIAFVIPALAAWTLITLIAIWAILTGILAIVSAVRLRRVIEGETMWILSGIVSIVLGIVLLLFPGAGLLAWAYMIGIYAVIAGVALLALAFRLRGLGTGVATS